MSNYRKSRTSNSAMSYKDPGPYVARVVGHLDPSYMGTLEVQLLSSSEVGDEDDVKAQLIRVKYASPFYGVTPLANITADNQYRNTQQSYGFWAVPPDVGTKVLVMFVEGDRSRGYWFACVPDEGMNFMVPDPRASTEITSDETPAELQGAKLPVSEYNKAIEESGTDPTQYKKPYNKDFTEILEVQGLLFDEIRGTTTSSARREVPSGVYGWSTPGPLDKRTSSPKGEQGVRESKVQYPSSRLGGSSIVMDDGDDKFVRATHSSDGPPFYINKEAGEEGGDETIPQNECIRIRTRTGHQILLHNSEDLIYIANSRGTAWIELTSDGKIDVHAQDSISMMTNQDFNLTAMRDINMEAGRNVNIRAAGRWSDEQAYVNGGSIRSGQVHIESYYDTNITSGEGGGTLAINTSRDWELNVEGDIKLTASGEMHLKSGQSFYQNSGGSFHVTSETSFYRKSKSNMYDLIDGIYYTQSLGPISVNSDQSIFQSAKLNHHMTSGENTLLHAIGGTFDIKSQGDMRIESESTASYKANGIKMQSTATLDIGATGAIVVKSNSTVDINGPAAASADPAEDATPAPIGITGNTPIEPNLGIVIGKLPRIILPYVFPGSSRPVPYDTIVPRAPQHEPWTHHENLDPLAFKSSETDRENPGELSSSDRILTPDTFNKGSGRVSSVVVTGSGGSGFGQEGSTETSGNRLGLRPNVGLAGRDGPLEYTPYDGTQPVFTRGPFAYSRSADGPLATIRTKRRGLTTRVAEVFKDAFQGFIDDLEDSGYEIKKLGGYYPRPTTSGTTWSWHASGAAIDINWPNTIMNTYPNGYFSSPAGGRMTPEQSTDMPVATVNRLIQKYGLGWGANWRNTKDAMHFSMAAGTEQGSIEMERIGRVPIPFDLVPRLRGQNIIPDSDEIPAEEDRRGPTTADESNPLIYANVKDDENQPNRDDFA